MKNLIIRAVCALGAMLAASCGTRQPSELVVIALDDLRNRGGTVTMSTTDIAQGVDFVLLKATVDEAIVGVAGALVETEDSYFILSRGVIQRFDRQGNFIAKIGNNGRGPGEYLSCFAIDVDEASQGIFALDQWGGKVLEYGFDGRFRRSFPLPSLNERVGDLPSFIDNLTIVDGKILYLSNTNSVQPDIHIGNLDGSGVVRLKSREREMGPEGFMGKTYAFGSRERRHIYHCFNDTVFLVGPGGELRPDYLLSTASRMPTYEELADLSGAVYDPRMQLSHIVETDDYLFVNYDLMNYQTPDGNRYHTALYDKRTDKFYPSVKVVHPEHEILSLPFPDRGYFAGRDGKSLIFAVEAERFDEGVVPVGPLEEGDTVLIIYRL